MSALLVHPAREPEADGTFLRVTPDSAGWGHVGFEVLRLVMAGPTRNWIFATDPDHEWTLEPQAASR